MTRVGTRRALDSQSRSTGSGSPSHDSTNHDTGAHFFVPHLDFSLMKLSSLLRRSIRTIGITETDRAEALSLLIRIQSLLTASSIRVLVMDIAYDHIQEEILNPDSKQGGVSQEDGSSNNDNSKNDNKDQGGNLDLNAEFQETIRAISSSAWGVRIGGFFDNVRKQGESYYEGARQEYAAASEEAAKGISDLKENIVDRTRGLSISTAFLTRDDEDEDKDGAQTPTDPKTAAEQDDGSKQEKVEESGSGASSTGEGLFSRFKAEASRRLKEIEKAEDAADEAILRFGKNVSQKLRDAVSIIPPDTDEEANKGQLLFESKDSDGKRVIHATRFDAQLHVIHSNLDNFTKDPASEQWPAFKEKFNVDSKTEAISSTLDEYPELRAAMEKLVPEKTQYSDFWCRYYFLRLVVETEEKKRKELLKGMDRHHEHSILV